MDFVGGGVAGALEGAPHIPTGDGAIGAPAVAEGEEFFGAGLVLFAVSDRPTFLHAEVVDGKNVRTAQAENQKHFDGPRADAANGDEALDEFFVGEFFGFFERRDDAADGFLREIFHGADFCAGEAGFTESFRAEFDHFVRSGDSAIGAERFDAGENCCGSFAGDGLVGDGFEESIVRRLVSFHSELERPAAAYEFGDDGIAAGEMFCCGVEIEGKSGRLIDHVSGPL